VENPINRLPVYYCLTALLILIAGAIPAIAIEIEGVLEGGTWTVADSPVQVVGNITLPEGETLVIDPGVRVEFQDAYQFIVHGLLRAEGTVEDMIVFTAADTASDSLSMSRRWKGIRFIDAKRGCRLSNCRIQYGWARTLNVDPHSVVVDGNYAYIADGDAGLRIVDVSDPAQPTEVGFYDTQKWAYGVAVSGNYGYIADREGGLLIINVADPAQSTQVGHYDTPGFACGVTINGDYAYVADYYDGLLVIDITDPAMPVEVGSLDTPGAAWSVTVSGNYAFVADDIGGLRIIDISDPTQPNEVGFYDRALVVYDVVVSGNYAYIADLDEKIERNRIVKQPGICVIDISDPTQPDSIAFFETEADAFGVDISGEYAYIACRQNGLRIVDISDPADLIEAAFYNPSGDIYGVTVSGDYAYIADWKENTGGLRIIDISDAAQVNEVGYYDTPGSSYGAWPEDNGGGVYIERSTVNIVGCEILRNRADGNGGGIYGWFTQSNVRNTIIAMNHTGFYGGGMFFSFSTPQIINCTVAFDTARAWGGGIFAGAESTPIITNSIITFNRQEVAGGLPPGDEFFSNLARAQSGHPTVTFSCVKESGEDAYPGPGNICADPEFIGIDSVSVFSFHLSYSSPCVDAGDPGMNAGPDDKTINMGAYGGTEQATPSVPVFENYNYIELERIVNFDSLRINSQRAREITIKNIGHARLFINDVQFSSDAFFPDSAEVGDSLVAAYAAAPIEPGENLKFSINFIPTELREYNATATFIDNDETQPPPVLDLIGWGIDPVASMQDTLNFGWYNNDTDTVFRYQIGINTVITIYLKNIGQSVLNLNSLSIQGDGFDIEIDDDVVQSGDSVEVEVIFEPENPTSYEASATIRTNDRNLLLILLGIGYGPKMVIERKKIWDEEEEDSLTIGVDIPLFLGYVYDGGDGPPDTTSAFSVPISNEGDDILIVNATVDHEAFSVFVPEGGLVIEPNESAELPINFHPPQANMDFTDYLVLTSNYPVPDSVLIEGRGMAEPGRYVFGEVSGIWDWDHDNPVDYIVLDSITVPAHEILKIKPGVRVLFEPGGAMRVSGVVRAIGLPGDSIYFLPRDASGTEESRWHGIELNLEDATRFSYAVMRGSVHGIEIRESSPLIQFCRIYDNGINTIGEIDGGGIFMENAGTRIVGCIIENNTARYGGGVYVLNSKPQVTNCVIRNNQALIGGAMYLRFQAGAWIQSNILNNNVADSLCGGIAVYDQSSPQLVNNTIVDNTGGGVFSFIRSIPMLINNIIWNNDGPSIQIGQEANLLASYSDIEGGYRGTSNLDMAPGFVNPSENDYHLTEDSPLIDAGNTEPSYRDYFFPPSLGMAINDIGAYGGPLGGGWETAEISISVFQNPAFPRWIDVFAISLDSVATAPVCSLSLDDNNPVLISLSKLNANAYRGEWEAPGSGTIFITVNADLNGGRSQKVGRTYNLAVLEPEGGGLISMTGVNGCLDITPGSFDNQLCVLTGTDNEIMKPTDKLLFLSHVFFIEGLNVKLDPPAELTIDFHAPGWGVDEYNRLGIYKIDGDNVLSLEGGYRNGQLKAMIECGGRFILGWEEEVFRHDESEQVPQIYNLLRAYPNPFNQSVSLEFTLNQAGYTHIGIFNLTGRQVAALVNRQLDAGKYITVWEGKDATGQTLPSGIYWARLNGAGQSISTKLLLLR